MKKIIFFILAVAAATVSCTRELEPEGSTLVPSSKYLVINADCSPMTKTNIYEGKSLWEAGDKISVLYKGDVYEYVAGTPSDDGKQTYFTSTAGIADYDGSELVAYYEPISAEHGTVGIAAERSIAFQAEGQVNSACAPLVGIPTSNVLSGGILNMYFKNIFSVIELRIDPAGSHMTSPAKTLKIEPADGSTFTGYISCSATVDPSTLALKTSSTGNSLTLKFPAGADLKLAQTLKFPVGRFTSSKGLKATLTLEDGSVLEKNIYKSGITTFSEDDGNFSVMHHARSLFAFTGGIACAQDLVDFAAAVNNGGSLIEYMNDEGKVVLLDDIDMTGVTDWTPIGNAKFVDNAVVGNAFTGHFDGQGHSITKIVMKPDFSGDAVDGRTYGLFGLLNGAKVENLTMGAKGDGSALRFKGNGVIDAGVVAGVCLNSTIRNCVNYVAMKADGNSVNTKRTTIAGIVGCVYSNAEKSSLLQDLVNHGAFNAVPGTNSTNAQHSVQPAGIVGYADGETYYNTIKNCVNYGNSVSTVPRGAGIVTTAWTNTKVESCINYGSITNSNATPRVGGISAAIGSNTSIKDCENHGNLTFSNNGTNTYVGGIVGLTSNNSVDISGGGNYGTVVAKEAGHSGLIAGRFTYFNSVDGVVAGGSVGTYSANENHTMATITKDNYMDYIGTIFNHEDNGEVTNIIFNGSGAAGIRTADDLMEFASLVNAGSSTAKFEQNGVVVLLNDIDMSGKTWTPIGNAKFVSYAASGNAFTGHFNGTGHSILNLKITPSTTAANETYGLFGILSGATVENLTMGAPEGDDSELSFSGNGLVDAGVIAGVCLNSTIRNCVNYVPMTCTGQTKNARASVAGFAGYVCANKTACLLENLVNYGSITATTSANQAQVYPAGIAAFTYGPSYEVTVSNCVNRGDINSATTYGAGITSYAYNGTNITGCVNNGDILNTYSAIRIGGIVNLLATKSMLTDCENYGDIIASANGTDAYVGGLVANTYVASSKISGGGNYGRVISTNYGYKGLIAGRFTHLTSVDGVVADGEIGTYASNGKHKMINLNSGNYMDNIGVFYAAADRSKVTNIIFNGPEALNVLFIGNSFTQDAVWHLPGILAATGISNVNMCDMYKGGQLMSAHNSGWDSETGYTCYTCSSGATSWSSTTGRTLAEVAESKKWDIVTIQEHTGNSAAWSWEDEDKTNIDAVISKIKASQETEPKIYYIMSQAYHDMSKAVGAPDWTQEEMFEAITDFTQNVMANCDLDGIISTGAMLQNLRTSSINNDLGLTRDGYHMDYGVARYGAACTIFETIFTPRYGIRLDSNSYRYSTSNDETTPITDANAPIALQAARYAIAKPYAITNMAENQGDDEFKVPVIESIQTSYNNKAVFDQELIIRGRNFSAVDNGNVVMLDNTRCTDIIKISETEIITRIPRIQDKESVQLKVSTYGGTSNTLPIEFDTRRCDSVVFFTGAHVEQLRPGVKWTSTITNWEGHPRSVNVVTIAKSEIKNLRFTFPSSTKITSEQCEEVDALIGVNAQYFTISTGKIRDYIKIDNVVMYEGDETNRYGNLDTGAFVFDGDNADCIYVENNVGARTLTVMYDNVMVSGPLLLDDGERVTQKSNTHNDEPHPRTAIGVTEDGNVLLVTIDGRYTEAIGMSTPLMQDFFIMLGAKSALNLDGGGSSAMYIKGKGLVNHPYNNNCSWDSPQERPVASIIYLK